MSRRQEVSDASGVLDKFPNRGILQAAGITVPTDGTAGYAPGCIYQKVDGTAGTQLYLNEGTATSCDFNATPVVADLLATGDEINHVADVSTRLVATTATQLAVTAAAHEGRDIVLTSTHTVTVTLPAATGSGNRFNFLVGVTGTDGSKIIQVANTTDVINGASIAANTQSTTLGFISTASDDTITLNFTTTGGVKGTRVTITDIAAGVFLAQIFNITTGNPATPFSNAV